MGDSILISPRARVINRLLWGSLINAAFTLVCSLVFQFGAMSLFLTPALCGVTFIYTTTLLTLTMKERKQSQQQQPPLPLGNINHSALTGSPAQPDQVEGASGKQGTGQTPSPIPSPPPHVLRKPTIVFAMLIALAWLAAFALLLGMQIIIPWEEYSDDKPPAKIGSPITETILAAGQVGIMCTLFVMCVKERRSFINAQGKWKWYELGNYKFDGQHA